MGDNDLNKSNQSSDEKGKHSLKDEKRRKKVSSKSEDEPKEGIFIKSMILLETISDLFFD